MNGRENVLTGLQLAQNRAISYTDGEIFQSTLETPC